jgi:hypothetical protein
MPDPQSKADARRTVADWLAMQLDGDQPELWVRVNASSPLLAMRTPARSLRDQPVGGMKMCTLLIGSNQAVAAPPGAMILRTPSSTMVTP